MSREDFLWIVHLWLHFNPCRSVRSLACRLREDLGRDGIRINVESLQHILAGKRALVRREIRDRVLDYLRELGIVGEEKARTISSQLADKIHVSVEGRRFENAERFLKLCRFWQRRHHQASTRKLAIVLREELSKQGLFMAIHHLQELVLGKIRRVRRSILAVMEKIVREETLSAAELEQEFEKISSDLRGQADLRWVLAEPIAAMARQWIERNPGTTRRQLALRLAKIVRRMGFSMSHNTIQPVAGGWKKKTRGFLYRAMLKLLGRYSARIPEEHLVKARWELEAQSDDRMENPRQSILDRRAPILKPSPRWTKPNLSHYLNEAGRCLADSPRPERLLDFIAWRIERFYRISRAKATDLLKAAMCGRLREGDDDLDAESRESTESSAERDGILGDSEEPAA